MIYERKKNNSLYRNNIKIRQPKEQNRITKRGL